MREIKFKVWDKNAKEMLEADYIDFKRGFVDARVDDNWRRVLKYDTYILIQYTGLKDVNGKEIYEDDIIEHLDGEYSFIGIVKYNPFGLFVKTDEDNISFEHFADDTTCIADCKVIGNIYENVDLLEVKE